jgi:cytosine/adenosine deaminase-related metal-dependent hydrolase
VCDAPVRNGCVTVDDGRIVDVESGPARRPREPRPTASDAGRGPRSGIAEIDLGRVAVLPALVNAHTHVELSYLHGRVPPSIRFGQWVRAVMAMLREHPDPADTRVIGAARQAIVQARAAGTGLVGDISNTLITVPLLREAGMPAQVFHELTGFTEDDPEARVQEARGRVEAAGRDAAGVRISLAPHAPYSVSAALFQAIRADVDAHAPPVSSVHLGETPQEVELLRHGTGDFRALLEELGRWPGGWTAPGVSPVAYLSTLGFLDSRALVVHGVQFDGEDLARLRAIDATLVSCPRSNRHVGVGAPPLEAFYAMDVRVAFGTDSLASVSDLNMFSELAEARRIAPRVPARRLIESATLTGARALGFEREYGSIEVGKRAALVAVRVPAHVTDVEEYLVSGVQPDAVSWVGT